MKLDLKGKRVLLRVDFNVPLRGNSIADDFRIRAGIPTIDALIKKGAQVFLITHLEQSDKLPHLDPIKKNLEKLLGYRVRFIKGRIPAAAYKVAEPVVLFDNIRLNSEEKKCGKEFSKRLAGWGDIFINDAFSVSHRKHASIVGLPKFLPHEMGPLMKEEISMLTKAFNPPRPFLFVLGGKKFETKEPLISRFLKNADAIFIGGAIGNIFMNMRGNFVGASKIERAKISDNVLWSNKIFLPEDVIVLRGRKKKIVALDKIEKRDIIYDAGPKTIRALGELAKRAKFILWNGTLGFCEEGFIYGTKKLSKQIGKSNAYKIIGGGDTVAAIRQMKLEKNFDFISTGGGAMLEFLAKGTLLGIAALEGEPRFRWEALKKNGNLLV